MYKRLLLNSILFSLLLVLSSSCDSDSNEIGADIIGNDNFETGTPEFFSVESEDHNTEATETLDLSVNALGIYKNPVFGTTKADLAIQLQLNTINPAFDSALDPQIDSVVLTVPYFSERLSTNTDGESTYKLDSIYGPASSKISLSVYESKYYIRDIDPQTQDVQKYYSDQGQDFDNLKGVKLNDSDDVSQNSDFVFSPAELVEPGVVTPETPTPEPVRSAPAMKINLNKAFFTSKIIGGAAAGKLLNNVVFKEYFRGLYFKVENSGSDEGNLAMLNIKAGKITISYNQKKSSTDATREDKTLVLNLNGKSVGFFENGPALPIVDERLYLKGGAGSIATIDLFGPDADNNGVADKLEELRANKWLVNDASLTFYIDNDAMGSAANEPNRIYLYDLKNKRPLVDYYADQNSPSNKPKYSKSVFGGIIKKVGDRGSYYKIRITNHIRGLIKSDSTNVKLGLVVTENIGDVLNKKLKTGIVLNQVPAFTISDLPSASVINPLGTILYGSGPNVPVDKRIQLKIYFTKPKQN